MSSRKKTNANLSGTPNKLEDCIAGDVAAIPVPGLNVAVKFRSLLEPNLNMIRFVGTLIGTYTALLLSQSLLDLIIQLLEQSNLRKIRLTQVPERFRALHLQKVSY
jgi:hypothetical protein